MAGPGNKLRLVREKLGYKLRDVESRSELLEKKYGNEEYALHLGRLSEIETKDLVPSIYKLYSLAVIYRLEFTEILRWYGLDLARFYEDFQRLPAPSRTQRTEAVVPELSSRIPVKLDPSFDIRKTSNVGRMIEQWGTVPFSYIESLSGQDYTYGYIGTEDFTMYPLLMPGTFVQVDESKSEVVEGVWRSEYERPIYFVETRDGFLCSWCSVSGDHIVLQPHPLSPANVRIMDYPNEADVVGQVVGIAMRLDRLSAPKNAKDTPGQPKLN